METVKPTKSGFASIAVPHVKQTEYLIEGIPNVRIRVGAKGALGFSLMKRVGGKPKRITMDVKELTKSGVQRAMLDAQGHAEIEADVGDINLRTVGEAIIDNDRLSDGTRGNYKNNLSRLIEFLGTKLTGNANDLLIAHREISDKYGKVSANNAMRFYRHVLNIAHARYNTRVEFPTDKLRVLKIWNTEKPRARRAEFSDIPAIWNAADRFPDPWGRILKFYLLTDMRNTEPFKMEVIGDDFVLPEDKAKNRQMHSIPMTPTLRLLYGDGFGVKNGRRVTPLVEDELGIKLTPHDYRRTFSSLANHAGVPDYTISMLLNHKKQDITGRYVGRTRDSMLLGLLKVEEAIEELLEGTVQQDEFDDPGKAIDARLERIRAIRARGEKRRGEK